MPGQPNEKCQEVMGSLEIDPGDSPNASFPALLAVNEHMYAAVAIFFFARRVARFVVCCRVSSDVANSNRGPNSIVLNLVL